jgi:hypothetical protein
VQAVRRYAACVELQSGAEGGGSRCGLPSTGCTQRPCGGSLKQSCKGQGQCQTSITRPAVVAIHSQEPETKSIGGIILGQVSFPLGRYGPINAQRPDPDPGAQEGASRRGSLAVRACRPSPKAQACLPLSALEAHRSFPTQYALSATASQALSFPS